MYLKGSLEHTFLTLHRKPLLTNFTDLVLKQAGPKNLPTKMHVFSNGVPEGSHSRPPGRSKLMAFERIFCRKEISIGRVAGTAQVP